MRIIDAFESGPSLPLGIKKKLDMGRPVYLGAYSNQMRLRHTFCSKKMSTQATGQGEPWTPLVAVISCGGVE